MIKRQASDGVLSSAELLAAMRSKRSLSPEADGADPVSQTWIEQNSDYMEMIRDIRSFVACGASVDGQASTSELLDQFRSRIPMQTTAKFKSMLKQLCSLHKIDGVGIWKLKPEFQ